MMPELFRVLAQSVLVEQFGGLHYSGVEATPVLHKKTTVGDLMRKGMLKGIFGVRAQSSLIEELGVLEVGETYAKLVLWKIGDRSQKGKRHVPANGGRRLKQVLFRRIE